MIQIHFYLVMAYEKLHTADHCENTDSFVGSEN